MQLRFVFYNLRIAKKAVRSSDETVRQDYRSASEPGYPFSIHPAKFHIQRHSYPREKFVLPRVSPSGPIIDYHINAVYTRSSLLGRALQTRDVTDADQYTSRCAAIQSSECNYNGTQCASRLRPWALRMLRELVKYTLMGGMLSDVSARSAARETESETSPHLDGINHELSRSPRV